MPTTVATVAMAVSMLPLYAVSALGPYLAEDLGVSRAAVGAPVTAAFAVAATVSLVAGRLVDTVGVRRGLLWLAAIVATALLTGATAGSFPVLVIAVAVTGLGMALANPATNVLVATMVPATRRGGAIGVKQSGVQLAAAFCGLVLPAVAVVRGWPAGLGLAGLLALGLLAATWWLVPRPAPRDTVAGGGSRGGGGGGPWWRWTRPPGWVVGLMGYSLLLGTGLSAVNTYLPLYGVQQLRLTGWSAGTLLAVFGAAGVVGRLWWTRTADRRAEVTSVLAVLSLVASASAVLVLAAGLFPPLVWCGAIGVGMSATGANAVSMLAVVRATTAPGHASALVSTGFFGGFVAGPVGVGLVADVGGYGVAWSVVAVVFAASGLAGWRLAAGRAAARSDLTGGGAGTPTTPTDGTARS